MPPVVETVCTTPRRLIPYCRRLCAVVKGDQHRTLGALGRSNTFQLCTQSLLTHSKIVKSASSGQEPCTVGNLESFAAGCRRGGFNSLSIWQLRLPPAPTADMWPKCRRNNTWKLHWPDARLDGTIFGHRIYKHSRSWGNGFQASVL